MSRNKRDAGGPKATANASVRTTARATKPTQRPTQRPSAGAGADGVDAGLEASGETASGSAAAERRGQLPSPGKRYYRIGEVVTMTGVKAHVLRYWETEFRWMAPPKSRSRQRLYRPKDIEMVEAIKKLLYEERYTIAGARIRLRELGLAKAREAAKKPQEKRIAEAGQESEHAGSLRAGYRQIRSELQRIRAML